MRIVLGLTFFVNSVMFLVACVFASQLLAAWVDQGIFMQLALLLAYVVYSSFSALSMHAAALFLLNELYNRKR